MVVVPLLSQDQLAHVKPASLLYTETVIDEGQDTSKCTTAFPPTHPFFVITWTQKHNIVVIN